MIKMVKVTDLKSIAGYRLWVKFSDGAEGIRDYSDMIAEGGLMIEPLKEQAFFNKVFISFGVPSWPNGFDVDAIALYRELDDAGLLTKTEAA